MTAFDEWYESLPTIDEVHITVEQTVDDGEPLPVGMAHAGACCADLLLPNGHHLGVDGPRRFRHRW